MVIKGSFEIQFPMPMRVNKLLPCSSELIYLNFSNKIGSQKFMDQQGLMISKEDLLDCHTHLHIQDLYVGASVTSQARSS